MSLGERLKMLRKQRKLSQEELTTRLGLNRGTYGQYEINRRQPDYETLKLLADFFSVSIDFLLLGKDQNEEQTIDLKNFFEENKIAHWDGVPLNEKQREVAYKFFSEVLMAISDEEQKQENGS